ncbi:hypothetical protein niasHT_001933 [Heterodera trifolii]|uniref:Transcription initiation factor TFIID subunit 10 n=1 Tax=Heterodera trifolii TaxID=157864 RepID=A0ABD2LSP2_9BILA
MQLPPMDDMPMDEGDDAVVEQPQQQHGAGAADQQSTGADMVQQQSSASVQYARPLVARPVTEQQIQALRNGSDVRPGSSLADFYRDLENYRPTIPDSVALYYMRKNGIANPDVRVVRLFSLAAQKFVSDICLDAMQQARIKGLGQVKKGQREAKYCLTTELLQPVLEEYGIHMDRPPYYQ